VNGATAVASEPSETATQRQRRTETSLRLEPPLDPRADGDVTDEGEPSPHLNRGFARPPLFSLVLCAISAPLR
jgi:hypothetical protein